MNNNTAELWFKQAYHNLIMSRKNFKIEGYDVTAFLCQQAVELLLKANIIYNKGELPKTHYLDILVKEVEISDNIKRKIIDLTVDYTYSRYPDVSGFTPYEQYTKEIVEDKLKDTEEIFEYFIKENKDYIKWKEKLIM